MGRPKKTIDQIRQDIKDRINPGQQLPVTTGSGNLPVPEEKKRPGRPPGSINKTSGSIKEKEKFSQETIRQFLKTPFTASRLVTGYDQFMINPAIEDDLVKMGYQIYLDFGFDAYSRWINLVSFVGLYGGNLMMCWSAYVSSVKVKRKEKEKDDIPKQDSGGIRKEGERKDPPDKKSDTETPEK